MVNASDQCLVTVAALSQVSGTFALIPPPPAVTPPSETTAEKKLSRKAKELARCKLLEGPFKAKCIAQVNKKAAKENSKGKKSKGSKGGKKKKGAKKSKAAAKKKRKGKGGGRN